MKTSRKFLKERTIAPRISELLSEVYDTLTLVTPNTQNFIILLGTPKGEDIMAARIIPTDLESMKEMMGDTDGAVRYIAHTDGDNNFIKGEEKNG